MYRIKLLMISLIIFIFTGCTYANVKLMKIEYLSVHGIELKSWGDNNEVDGRPDEIELFVTIKNQGRYLDKLSQLHIEFWAGKAEKIIITDEGYSDYDIDKMRDKTKWSILWEKDISLENLRPKEERRVKVGTVNIYKLFMDANKNEEIKPIGWRCKVFYEKSKIEKTLYVEYVL